MSTQDELRTGFDPDARELCPDGACIGVIGSDGRCGECGQASPKKPQAPDKGRKPASEAPPPTAALAAEGPASTATAPRQVEGDTFDPAHRELCPDGACIGVIGSDGRCAECGKASPGGSTGARAAPSGATAADDSDPEPPADPHEETGDDDRTGDEGDAPTDIEERRLCPDGACIGVIGPNGRCKTCGTRAD